MNKKIAVLVSGGGGIAAAVDSGVGWHLAGHRGSRIGGIDSHSCVLPEIQRKISLYIIKNPDGKNHPGIYF